MKLRYCFIISLLLGNLLAWNIALADDDYGNWVLRGDLGGLLPTSNKSILTIMDPIRGDISYTGQSFVKSAVGGNVDLSYFFFDHFALDGSVGWFPETNSDVVSINIFPMALLAQYHIAPYGEIRPYVGAGVVYPYVDDSTNNVSTNSKAGAAAQIGFDWWGYHSVGFNMDIRYYDMKTTTTINSAGLDPITIKTSPDPVIISAGISYRF